jgi:transposase InsO family protein
LSIGSPGLHLTSPTPKGKHQRERLLLQRLQCQAHALGLSQGVGSAQRRGLWDANRKKIQRLWLEEGLKAPPRRRKRQRLGTSTCSADRLRAERPNQIWALDFQFDQTSDGMILKLLNMVDEHSREEIGRAIGVSENAQSWGDVARDLAASRRHVWDRYIGETT